ncbi:MAG: DNA methyltransferase [Candidatus Kapaibacterium sp.]
MPLSWNEIRDRAVQFSREWEDVSSEDAEAKSFLDAFFNVFGISRRRIASFEEKVTKLDGKTGYIDLLWKGKLLVEHKSRGKNLDLAFKQATDYFPGLKEAELPRYVLVCDFENFRLKDLDNATDVEFKLKDFPANIKHFGFIAGYETHTYKEQDPVNIQAAERMGKLHDELRDIGYIGHELEVLLVRLLFCLFAEDTGIFMPTGIFEEYIRNRTSEDGSDLARLLSELFDVLNTKEKERLKNLDEDLARFPYVNGTLFSERLRSAAFTSKMRQHLLGCCELNWSTISPAIFGALFQSIMDKNARRNLGAHYTSEQNILKLIKPLFLDALWEEFHKIKRNPQKLAEFQKKLRGLNFLDPACGCGNFLVIAYREIRLLEFEVLRLLHKEEQLLLDLRELLLVNVDQFFGIEIEEFPAQIAQVALWLVDHQMNTMIGARFGQHFARIPLTTSPTIVNDNALRVDWMTVVPKKKLSYILGNPPFVGKHYQSKLQREDQSNITRDIKSGMDLDHVACWFIRAAEFTRDTSIRFAFVATNSISQGEQVPLLWSRLFGVEKLKILFAHRTFRWSNEARGMAAVHCVIIGLSREEPQEKLLFDYDSPSSEPHEIKVSNISPYLTAGPDNFVSKKQKPFGNVPTMNCGSKPSDGGHLILDSNEKAILLKQEPSARRWIKKYVGSDEFINAIPRWCLWLNTITPSELKSLPLIMKRVDAVRRMREASTAAPTQRAAERPYQFFFISQPSTKYIAIPEVSSERRKYVPLGILTPDVISSNKIYIIPSPSKYLFGVLHSAMHMAWLAVIGGRLESRFQYSATMVYNTFPWPESPTAKQKFAIEQAAQSVLDVRAKYPESSLADLYDPLTMPSDLLKAHQKLDKAVDAAYGKRTFATEAERVAYLFELYQKLTEPLMAGEGKKKAKTKVNG